MANVPQRIARLAERLENLGVALPGDGGSDDPPAWALSYDLTELEDGARVSAGHIARLREDGGDDNWSEVREEIRHLLYHLRAPAFSDLADSVDR